VCAAFTHAFISCVKDKFVFKEIAIAIDNRPSSFSMAQACAKAVEQAGFSVVYYGVAPTPALAYVSMQDNIPSIMVTGSHIPFDRNGLKFYRPDSEISKDDELAILNAKIEFENISNLPNLRVSDKAAVKYMERYTSLFNDSTTRDSNKHIPSQGVQPLKFKNKTQQPPRLIKPLEVL
jgi:phosphomannomutase